MLFVLAVDIDSVRVLCWYGWWTVPCDEYIDDSGLFCECIEADPEPIREWDDECGLEYCWYVWFEWLYVVLTSCGIVRFFSAAAVAEANEYELIPPAVELEPMFVSSIRQWWPPIGDDFRLSLILLLLEIIAGFSTEPTLLFIDIDWWPGDGTGIGSGLIIGSIFVTAVFRLRDRGFGFGLIGCCAIKLVLLLLLMLLLLPLPYGSDCDPPNPTPYPSISGVGFVILLNVALNALLLSSIDDAVFSK